MDKVKTERIALQKRELLEKARSLPTKPGCYLMKNTAGQIIYIGKAKSLKSRVMSYFQESQKSIKTEILVSHILNFEFFMTETEAEALVLENNLIKQHGPKYNIRLKDDKSYPYVVIDHGQPFPKLQYLRRVKREANKEVFGPFVTGSRISEVMKVLTKSFQLRDCSLREFYSRKEPCLLYQMKQCSAPCVQKISKEAYEKNLEMALQFLRGKPTETLDHIQLMMEEASELEQFELAAHLRDHKILLSEFLEEGRQRYAELPRGDENIDLIATHTGEYEVDMTITMVRNGLMLGHKNFHYPIVEMNLDFLEPEEEIVRFLMDYYSSTHDSYPEKIYLEITRERKDLLQEGLKTIGPMKVRRPTTLLQSMLRLTQDQALESQRFRLKNSESLHLAHTKLQELLNMSERPRRLECYDVAIFQGTSPTAAQIVFEEGRPVKEKYRHFHLEERPEGNNDFAMMTEIIERRIKHGDLPDIFIVDGGIGQVNMFLAVLRDFKISIPVVGIAKSKTKGGESQFQNAEVLKSEERLIIPGRSNPYILAKTPGLFRLIVQMRDEAHRFSRRLHHHQEKKRTFQSWLDEIEGVGDVTKKKIQSKIKYTQAEILEISVNQLALEWGISEKMIERIKDHLRKGPAEE